jgi:ABC-type lipoprotein release transport system permease subunit
MGAWFAGRAMTSLQYGVAPGNLTVLLGTVVVLSMVALIACLLPSRRAARVEPIEALRRN